MSKHSKRIHTQKAEPAASNMDTGTVRETPQEHRTFTKLQEQFEEFSRKRPIYIKYGLLSIFVIPIVFLVLMFSLESKLIFLVLWIVSIIACAVFLIVVEYKDYWYRQLLGLNEEESENLEETENCPPFRRRTAMYRKKVPKKVKRNSLTVRKRKTHRKNRKV